MQKENLSENKKLDAQLLHVIHKSKIFSEIDRTACEALLPHLEKISLPQGEVLFKQGDASDSLYILVDGQLIAVLNTIEGKQKILGTVEQGETVGELGALSSQPRSLTVQAAVNCRLLKLPQKEFDAFSKEQPGFISRVIDLIIQRSQNTLKLISQKKIYKHIAIVSAIDSISLKQFMKRLRKNFPVDPSHLLIENAPPEMPLSQYIDLSEQQNKSVIFILDEQNIQDIQIKLNHIGSIFIVANGDRPTVFSDFVINIMNRQRTPFCTQYELILVHDDHVVSPSGTKYWLSQAQFTLHHHIRLNDSLDYQRILRFMMGKAVGLVLGGGGHKGWASIGVLKALLDSNITIDAVGGTSVGSVIAGCFAKHLAYQGTFNSFKLLSHSVSNPFSFKNLTLPLISLISTKVPTEMLIQIFEDIQIEDMWLPFFAITSNITKGIEGIHREGTVWQVIRASTAIPGIAPPMEMNGELFYDGALLNNLPVDHMRALLGDEAPIIAVMLTGLEEEPKIYHFPPVITFWMALMKKLKLGYKDYTFPPFFHTFVQSLLIGSSARENANQLLATIVIRPELKEYRILKLKTKGIHNMIQIGYKAALAKLKLSKIFPRETGEN